jgi:hypothetical protein
MSLYQISIINILNNIKDGNISLRRLENLPEDLELMLNKYVLSNAEYSFIISVSNCQFQLADYFYPSIDHNNNKINTLIHAMREQINIDNISGIEYLLNKSKYVSSDGYDTDIISIILDEGLYSSAKLNNLILVKWFIKNGSKNLDRGLSGAVHGNRYDLVKFFINKGAIIRSYLIEFAVKMGYTEIVYLLQSNTLIVNTKRSLAIALNNKSTALIDLLIPERQAGYQAYVLQQKLLLLLHNVSLISKSGISYEDMFPLLKQNYCIRPTINGLIKLYGKQHKDHTSSILPIIIGNCIELSADPANKKSEENAIYLYVVKFGISRQLFAHISPELNNHFNQPSIIDELYKESVLITALALTYEM